MTTTDMRKGARQTVRRRRYHGYIVTWAATGTRKGGERRFATEAEALTYLAGPRIAARAAVLEYEDRAGWRDRIELPTSDTAG